MVSVCLPSDALLQHLPSYLGFSYLGRGGTTKDEMAGWHHGLNGCESEWTLGDGDEQGGLACCNSWGRKESDMTERLNWTELIHIHSKNNEVYFTLQCFLANHQFPVLFTMIATIGQISSVQFSCWFVSDSLRPQEMQHESPPSPSPTPGVYQIHVHWVGDAI